MKTIKPQKLGVLCRCLESDQRTYFVVSLLVFFPLDAPRHLLTEVALWQLVEKALGKDGVLDEGHSKSNGELIVHGKCFPSTSGEARPVSYVRAQLGGVDKKLAVIGDRVWKRGVPTEPAPFTEMPIDWAHAFGGPGFAQNPLGKGFAPVSGDAGEVHPLPNIEVPGALVRSPKDRPTPASFRPIDLMWPQRFSKVGTYDAEWLKTRFPGVAKDLDPSFFNTAPNDQQIRGYFRGDEAFVIENMHPTRARIEGKLPGVAGRAFITQRTKEGDAFRELKTRLDTVLLFPEAERGVLVFRGMIEIAEDDASDVVHLVIACEDASAPRPVEHYQGVLALRLDKKKGTLAALQDRDLMPPAAGGAVPNAPKSDVAEMIEGEDLLRKNLLRKQDKQRAEAKAFIESKGLRPEEYGIIELPPEEPVPSIEDPDAVAAYVEKAVERRDKMMVEAEAKKVQAEADGRKLAEKHGVDYDKMMDDAKKRRAGPPKFSADAELAQMRRMLAEARDKGAPMPAMEAKALSPAYEQEMRGNEERLHAAYRRFAHHQPAGAALEGDEAARVRDAAVRALAQGESFAQRDFTGVDLRGVDLSGKDLRLAYLEGANLEDVSLVGANLEGAVLARANLTQAKLAGAKLAGANLGGAKLAGADLAGADLGRATLTRADLTGASFRGASLGGADLFEATFGRADFSAVKAPQLLVLRADASGCSFAGAEIDKGRFVECDVRGADFSDSRMEKVSFVTVQGEGAVFRRAQIKGAVFVHGSVFPRASFEDACLDSANLMGTDLTQATFARASLAGANLAQCTLRGARLERAAAPGAMLMKADLSGASLVKANLMGALMSKADIAGADLTGSNLFRSDLSRTHIDGATKIGGANLKHARVEPRSRDERR